MEGRSEETISSGSKSSDSEDSSEDSVASGVFDSAVGAEEDRSVSADELDELAVFELEVELALDDELELELSRLGVAVLGVCVLVLDVLGVLLLSSSGAVGVMGSAVNEVEGNSDSEDGEVESGADDDLLSDDVEGVGETAIKSGS